MVVYFFISLNSYHVCFKEYNTQIVKIRKYKNNIIMNYSLYTQLLQLKSENGIYFAGFLL